MAEVFIWDFRGKRDAWGHASMKVGNKYISWWPMATGREPKRVLETAIHPHVYSAHPIVNRRYSDDVRDEGMLPNHSITLNGLNERKILSWWERTSIWANPKLQGPPSHPWSSLGWNCVKIVATALSKGGEIPIPIGCTAGMWSGRPMMCEEMRNLSKRG